MVWSSIKVSLNLKLKCWNEKTGKNYVVFIFQTKKATLIHDWLTQRFFYLDKYRSLAKKCVIHVIICLAN